MGATRKVRQVFDPVLPDEILVKLGEQLTIVQSFDDGWCVVGREGGVPCTDCQVPVQVRTGDRAGCRARRHPRMVFP